MNTNLFGEKVIKVSAAWCNKEIGCELQFIIGAGGCGGKCCTGKTYYPAKSNGDVCFHLGPEGCKLLAEEKPNICLLYPLTILNDTLVLHGRALLGCCKPNYKRGGKTIFEQLKDNLIILFGEEQYTRVAADLKDNRDSYFTVTTNFEKQQQIEKEWQRDNIIPKPIKR